MKIFMTEVIAERILSGPTGAITVQIGLPYEPEGCDGELWCPYLIDGLGHSEIKRAIGGDTMQALTLCLYKVSADLHATKEYREGKISWRGASYPGDLGIPSLLEE